MNTYNENLRSRVMASLQALRLTQKSIQAERDAAIFTLYYAQGARITAQANLNAANKKLLAYETIKEQALNAGSVTISLLNSADHQKNYTAQSVTNNAINASNIQIASNAIVRLSAGIGSIVSMLKAGGDNESEIYSLAETANNLLNTTAYAAELLSQNAMEASTLTAEISAPAVTDTVKSTSNALTGLLNILAANHDAAKTEVNNYSTALSAAIAAEQQTEGALKLINTEFFAAGKALQLNNKELNLNLRVPEQQQKANSYSVSFAYYKSPFPQLAKDIKPGDPPVDKEHYPVKRYGVILVKERKLNLFTLADAEQLMLDPSLYVEVPAAPQNHREASVNISISQLHDSDGDAMILGEKYVVFVFAELMEQYKKTINNFDNYLSAPSAAFGLTIKCVAPDESNINIDQNKITFSINGDIAPTAEYRCILLPHDAGLTAGSLSEAGLDSLEKELEKLGEIEENYAAKIMMLEMELQALEATLSGYSTQLEELQANGKDNTDAINDIKIHIEKANNQANTDKETLKKLQADKTTAIAALTHSEGTEPGFFFDIKIAEQITAANYTLAQYNKDNKLFEAVIDECTTDNFGNQLVSGQQYTPLILAVPGVQDGYLPQYANAISGTNITDPFTYSPDQKSNNIL